MRPEERHSFDREMDIEAKPVGQQKDLANTVLRMLKQVMFILKSVMFILKSVMFTLKSVMFILKSVMFILYTNVLRILSAGRRRETPQPGDAR